MINLTQLTGMKFKKHFGLLCFAFVASVYTLRAQQYDFEIILDKIVCKKAVELWPDTQDDLFGFISIGSYVIKNTSGVLQKSAISNTYFSPSFYNELPFQPYIPFLFWSKSKDTPLRLATGQSLMSGVSYKLTALNITQLMSLELLVGGQLSDVEMIPIRYQPCSTCAFSTSVNSNYRLVKLSSYESQINSMTTGTAKFLQIGADQVMQLDFFETDPNSAHVQFLFKIKITKKA